MDLFPLLFQVLSDVQDLLSVAPFVRDIRS